MNRTLCPIWLVFLLCHTLNLFAQNDPVYLHTGTTFFPENLDAFTKTAVIEQAETINGFYYKLLQFNSIPTKSTHEKIERLGIKLLDYIPSNTYVAAIPTNFELNLFPALNVRSIQSISTELKLSEELKKGFFPEWATTKNMVFCLLKFYQNLDLEEVEKYCAADEIEIISKSQYSYFLKIKIAKDRISEISKLPYVAFLDLIPPPDQPDDLIGRSMHRSNAIDVSFPTGRHFDGTGVGILCRDDGMVGPHIDFQGRLDNSFTAQPNSPGGSHGDGVCGIMGGAGNLNPKFRGMARGADIFVVNYEAEFLDETMNLHLEKDVLVTNSSYSNGCNAGYTPNTETVDNQLFDYPTLQHVFSAGNSNSLDCGYGAGNQWGNITGGHKQAKNAIAVANLKADGKIDQTSSRGPAHDGRIKPDLAAFGTGHISTDDNNSYQTFGGTSAAAPGVAGVLAQLHQAYRQLKNGQTAEAALLKACLLNTAKDLGQPGPDFIYGWGQVNALRSLQVLEQNQNLKSTISHGQTNQHSLSIPEGVVEAKVMIYWNDPASTAMSQHSLINNLDTKIIAPNAESYLPWVLNTSADPNLLNTPATKGIDSLNNMEQIVLKNPGAGTYTLQVDGKTTPFGAADYFVVWDFLQEEIALTHPIGGESFEPGDTVRLTWDAADLGESYLLYYSTNNGVSFLPIANVPATKCTFDWVVPNTITGNALIKITRGNNGAESINVVPFSIAPRPKNVQVVQACPDFLKIKWDAVNFPVSSNNVSYQVFLLGKKYMEVVGSTTSTEFDLPTINNNPLNDHWIAVRAIGQNNIVSERTVAINYNGGLLNCTQQNDLSLVEIIAPGDGPIFGCGSANISVIVKYKNNGLAPQSNIKLGYQLNNNSVIIETVGGIIQPGQTKSYQFNTPLLISGSSEVKLKAFTVLSSDLAVFNDSDEVTFSMSLYTGNGQPIDYYQDFEDTVFPPSFYAIANPDENITWDKRAVVGINGELSNCIFLNNYSYSDIGQEDAFLVVPINLENATNPIFNFDISYARYNSNYSDSLKIEISTDCGQSFNKIIYAKQGLNLATVADHNQLFLPTSADEWRKESISLNEFIGHSVVIKFTNITGYGNSLFIDNINVLEHSLPTANFTASQTSICQGEPIIFTNHANGSNLSYNWSFGPSASPSQSSESGPISVVFTSPGTYSVVLSVSNSFGVSTFSQIINVKGLPEPSFDFSTNGQNVIFSNNSENANSYLWDFGDGTFSTTESPVHNFQTTGIFQVYLEAKNSCGTAKTEATEINFILNGVDSFAPIFTALIYPNPNNGSFTFSFNNKEKQTLLVNIKDVRGRSILTKSINSEIGTDNFSIQCPVLSAGLYFLEIQGKKGKDVLKFVVE